MRTIPNAPAATERHPPFLAPPFAPQSHPEQRPLRTLLLANIQINVVQLRDSPRCLSLALDGKQKVEYKLETFLLCRHKPHTTPHTSSGTHVSRAFKCAMWQYWSHRWSDGDMRQWSQSLVVTARIYLTRVGRTHPHVVSAMSLAEHPPLVQVVGRVNQSINNGKQ